MSFLLWQVGKVEGCPNVKVKSSGSYLLQRLLITVLRGNTTSTVGTIGTHSSVILVVKLLNKDSNFIYTILWVQLLEFALCSLSWLGGPAWLWFPHVRTMCLYVSKKCLHTVTVKLATTPAQSFTGLQYSSTDEYNHVGSMSNSLSIHSGWTIMYSH